MAQEYSLPYTQAPRKPQKHADRAMVAARRLQRPIFVAGAVYEMAYLRPLPPTPEKELLYTTLINAAGSDTCGALR